METISNIASTATTTVSTLIYGEQAEKDGTVGKQPVSGEQGQGTATDPYDQGNLPTPMQPADKAFPDKANDDIKPNATDTSPSSNEFLKLTPVVHEAKNEEEAPKIHTNAEASTYTGMPVVPLADAATEGANTTSSPTPGVEVTETAEGKDTVLKETPLDDILHVGAPGAVTTSDLAPPAIEKPQLASADVSPRTSAPPSVTTNEKKVDTAKSVGTMDTQNPFGEKSSSQPKSSPSEEKSSKKSSFREKLKGKLKIGSKDK